jgi:hypothetical protein
MSGVEAVAVLGVISSIISILDGARQVYDAATDVHGLPEAFREIAGRLPIVTNILGLAKQHIDTGNVSEASCQGVKRVVEACEKKAEKLDELFHKALPADGASGLKRYYKAVKSYGRGNEVEILMKGMLEDLQLVACEHGMKTATRGEQEQIVQAITDISAVAPSVPEHVFQEVGFTANNYGTGIQSNYNVQGDQYSHSGSGKMYISGGAPMTFNEGKD